MNTKQISFLFFVLFVIASSSLGGYAQSGDPEDIIAKHRASIGDAKSLGAIKNQLVVADAQFVLKGSAVVLNGKALVLSAAEKNMWGMNFNSNDYPQDRFGFNGKDTRVGKSTPSRRSLIGDFLYSHPQILRDGLLGGTLSASWPLLQADNRKAKIKYEGRKNIDGKEMLLLSFSPKGTSDLDIKIYLDAATHQHLRTEYTFFQAAVQGPSIDRSASQPSTIVKLTEEFSKYSKIGNLTLPGHHKITYARSGTSSLQTNNRDAEWTFTITNVGLNNDITDASFEVDVK